MQNQDMSVLIVSLIVRVCRMRSLSSLHNSDYLSEISLLPAMVERVRTKRYTCVLYGLLEDLKLSRLCQSQLVASSLHRGEQAQKVHEVQMDQ